MLNTITQESLYHNIDSLGKILPELALVGAILLTVLLDLIINDRKKALLVSLSLFLLASVSMVVFGIDYCLQSKDTSIQHLFADDVGSASFVNTRLAAFFKLLMGVSGILLVIFNQLEFKKNSFYEEKSEYYVAVLSVLLGSSLMLGATHFLTLIIALEISSFGAYALIFFNDTKKSKEASVKYILYGLMATGIMLFGMSLIYMEIGSLSYDGILNAIVENITSSLSPILSLGLVLFLAGFMFKLATVPMHIWVPDAFEGGPTSSVAFLSIVPKIGVLGNLVLFFSSIYTLEIGAMVTLQQLLLILGLLTLTIGNFFALGQHNIKRLLGYSSIAHSGFLLLALAIFDQSGLNSLLFYTLVYVFMNFSIFMLADFFIDRTGSEDIRKWSGAGGKLIFMSSLMVIVLIALIGLPPTAGFSAKLFVFAALVENFDTSGDKIMLIALLIGVFNMIISLFYYLKIPFYLFFQKTSDDSLIKSSLLSNLQLILVTLPILVLFLFSEKALMFIQQINYIVKYLVQ